MKAAKTNPYLQINRVEFMVTYHCSGRCRHCSVGEKVEKPTKDHCVQAQEAIASLRWLCENYPITSVMTFGGEPLLYPETTCALHRTAARCGVQARQVITNGYFSKNRQKVQAIAEALTDAGVNDVLLSVDAFHQERIPLDAVRHFAYCLQQSGMPQLRLQPAWLVNREHNNPYNEETERLLSQFDGVTVNGGNDIFLDGNAAKYLKSYYPDAKADFSGGCGSLPYTSPLTQIDSLSIVPNGDVMICSFAIGNIYQESIADIVSRYQPQSHPVMKAALHGGKRLLQMAKDRGMDTAGCFSVCDLCRRLAADHAPHETF